MSPHAASFWRMAACCISVVLCRSNVAAFVNIIYLLISLRNGNKLADDSLVVSYQTCLDC